MELDRRTGTRLINDRFWFAPAPSFGSDAYRIRPAYTNNMLLSKADSARIIQFRATFDAPSNDDVQVS